MVEIFFGVAIVIIGCLFGIWGNIPVVVCTIIGAVGGMEIGIGMCALRGGL